MSADSIFEYFERLGGFVSRNNAPLYGINLSDTTVADDDLSLLSNLISIEHLNFENCTVTDRGISLLGSLTNLRHLDLNGTAVTGSCFANLSNCPLTHLKLTRCKHLIHQNLQFVSKIETLQWLWLNETMTDDDSLAHLTQMKCLKMLSLANTLVTDKGMRHLALVRSLRTIDVEGTMVTNSGIDLLLEKIPEFRRGLFI